VAAAAADVDGAADGSGGQRPGTAVDYSKLSPLQQIALGLRDARPAGAVRLPPRVRRSSAAPAPRRAAPPEPDDEHDLEPLFHGAD
jgi:hypothetical protein